MVANAARLPGTRTPAMIVAWWILLVLSWVVAAWSVSRYAALDRDLFFDEQRDTYLQHLAALYAHAMGGVIALAIGPLQFHEGIRNGWPRFHRACGGIYAASIVMAGCAALVLAPVAFGATTSMAFGALGILWLGTTSTALYCIRRRDFAAHRRWAIRSFSLTFAAVTLRLWVGALMVSGADFDTAYEIAAWLCWVPNLIVAETIARGAAPSLPSPASQGREPDFTPP